jgi:hypothetical protein|eukprot:COSAG02_NODE_3939_length_6012_cov_129.782006_3_plen_266_part_00
MSALGRRLAKTKWEWRVWFPASVAPKSLAGTAARRGALEASESRQDVYWHLGSTLTPVVGLKEREANAFELKTRVDACERSGMEAWSKQKICDLSRTELLETRHKLDADSYLKALGLKKLKQRDVPDGDSKRQREQLCALRSIATATLVDTGLLDRRRVAKSVIPTLAAPLRTSVLKQRWKTYDSHIGAKVECVDVELRMPWAKKGTASQLWTSFAVEGDEHTVREWHEAHFTPWWEKFQRKHGKSAAIVAGYPEFVGKIAQSQR